MLGLRARAGKRLDEERGTKGRNERNKEQQEQEVKGLVREGMLSS